MNIQTWLSNPTTFFNNIPPRIARILDIILQELQVVENSLGGGADLTGGANHVLSLLANSNIMASHYSLCSGSNNVASSDYCFTKGENNVAGYQPNACTIVGNAVTVHGIDVSNYFYQNGPVAIYTDDGNVRFSIATDYPNFDGTDTTFPIQDSFNLTGYITATDWALYAIAIGNDNHANGSASFVCGSTNTASGFASFVSGFNNTALDDYTTIFGRNNTGSASSHIVGVSNTATGFVSHAEGNGNIVSGNYSHVQGRNNTVSSNYADAMGYNANAYLNGQSVLNSDGGAGQASILTRSGYGAGTATFALRSGYIYGFVISLLTTNGDFIIRSGLISGTTITAHTVGTDVSAGATIALTMSGTTLSIALGSIPAYWTLKVELTECLLP